MRRKITETCTECQGTGDGRLAKPDKHRIPGEGWFAHHLCDGTGRITREVTK